MYVYCETHFIGAVRFAINVVSVDWMHPNKCLMYLRVHASNDVIGNF